MQTNQLSKLITWQVSAQMSQELFGLGLKGLAMVFAVILGPFATENALLAPCRKLMADLTWGELGMEIVNE